MIRSHSELWDALRAIGRAEQGTIAALAALGGLVGVRGRAPERGTIAALAALGGLVGGEGALAREEREKK